MDEYKVTNSIFELANTMRKVATKILKDEFDTSFSNYQALAVLDDWGEITQHKLATYLMISDPAVSRIVKILEDEGYVTRRNNPNQKRQQLVSITTHGKEIHSVCRHRLESVFANTLADANVDLDIYKQNTRSIINAIHKQEENNEYIHR